MEKPPLTQILSPGEYRVEWDLPTQDGVSTVSLDGDIHLRADRQPIGYAYGPVPSVYSHENGTSWAGFPQVYKPGLIRGTLLNGLQVVLIDPTVEIWVDTRAVITARAALVGRADRFPEEPGIAVSQIEMQISGLDCIAGIPPLRSSGRKENSGATLDWSWEVRGEPASVSSWSDDVAQVEVRFLPGWRPSMDHYRFYVIFSPIVRVKLQRSISFNEAISDWVSPLRYIVALGTGRKEESTYLSIRVGPDRSDDLTFQVYGSSLGQMPYASDGNAILKVRRAFSISTHHLSLLELLRSWQELERLHHPLLETYGSLMFVAEQHPRSRYLLLIQALEGLDGFDTRADRQKNVAAHSGRRTAVLEALQRLAGALGSEEIKFIKKFLNKRPLSSLDDCLRRTIQGLPIDTASELGDTALVRSVMAERANGDYATCLRIVRNDLAHGNRGYDAFELHEAAEILDRVVRAHLAKALGCGDTVQSRILEKDH